MKMNRNTLVFLVVGLAVIGLALLALSGAARVTHLPAPLLRVEARSSPT